MPRIIAHSSTLGTVETVRAGLRAFMSDAGSQVILTVLNFLITPFVLLKISPESFGSWQAATAVLSYCGLVDAGLGVGVIQVLAKVAEPDARVRRGRLLSSAQLLLSISGAIFLILGAVCSGYVSSWFGIPLKDQREVQISFLIAVVAGSIGIASSNFNAVLASSGRLATANLIRFFGSALGALSSVGMLTMGFGLRSLAISTMISITANTVLTWHFARNSPHWSVIRLADATRADLRQLLLTGGFFQLGRIGNLIASTADPLVIGALFGASAITPYYITGRLPTLISVVVASKLPSAFFPALCRYYGANDVPKLIQTFLLLASYSSRLAILGATYVLLFNSEFVQLWTSADKFAGAELNAVFAYIVLQDSIFRGCGAILQATGSLRNWSYLAVVEALFNIVLSLTLGGVYGIVGVALATALTRTISLFIYGYWTCNELKLRPTELAMSGVLYPSLLSLPSIAILALCAYFMPDKNSWTHLVGAASLGVVVNVAMNEGASYLNYRPFDKVL